MGSIKKRVLIFSDWFLPGYKAGGPIKSLSNLVHTLNSDFEIFLACGDRDYLETAPYKGIELNKWLDNYGIKLIYLPPKNQQINTLVSIIDKLNPEVVYINGIFSRPFSINPLLALRKSKRKIIVAPRGMLAKGALSVKAFKKALFLNFAKLLRLYDNVLFHATSEQEKSDISRYYPQNKIRVIPNLPAPILKKRRSRKKKTENSINILCIARIAPEKNIDFVLDCLPGLSPEISVKMDFIGSVYDKTYMKKCISKSKSLPENIQVRFLDSKTPTEIEAFYEQAHLFFLPTLGENYGHAIVESIRANIPVLISDKTPWRDLDDDRLGAEYPLNEYSKFTSFIEKLAGMNESEYHQYSKGIASRFSTRVDLKGNISSYKELFNAEG